MDSSNDWPPVAVRPSLDVRAQAPVRLSRVTRSNESTAFQLALEAAAGNEPRPPPTVREAGGLRSPWRSSATSGGAGLRPSRQELLRNDWHEACLCTELDRFCKERSEHEKESSYDEQRR